MLSLQGSNYCRTQIQLRSISLGFLAPEFSSVTWSSLNKFYFSLMRQPFKYLRRLSCLSLNLSSRINVPSSSPPSHVFKTFLQLTLWLRPLGRPPLGTLERLDSSRCVPNIFYLLLGPILSIFVKILLSFLSPSSNSAESGFCDRHCAGPGWTSSIYLTSLFRVVLGSQ